MNASDILSYARFALLCAASAMLAYILAQLCGLDHPVWAPVSAVVAKPDGADLKESSSWRFIGTILGAAIAVMAYDIGHRLGWSLTLEIGVAVAIASVVAKFRPSIRVCLWTGVVVLLTTSPGLTVQMTAFNRSCEVMLGLATSLALHTLNEQLGILAHRWQLHFRSRKH
jgi:uncharacterized membrane protein YgaE (UPF0421/DUF939 family)